jgi:hypothetical protein
LSQIIVAPPWGTCTSEQAGNHRHRTTGLAENQIKENKIIAE